MRVTIPLLGVALLAVAGARAQDIAPETIQSRIVYLASDSLKGRGSGERGNEQAARYVADIFRKAGLKPLGTARQRDPKARLDGSGYFQPFAFPAGVSNGRRTRLEVDEPMGARRLRVDSEFEPHPLSARGDVSGEIVFVGAGAQESDYAGIDPAGKLVLVSAGGGNASINIAGKAAIARSKGAAAVLVIPPADGAAALRVDTEAVSTDAGLPVVLVRRKVASDWLEAAGKPLDAAEKDGRALATRIRARLIVDTERVEKVTANLVGVLEGADPALKNEYVVVGAHMDHLGLGGAHSLAEDRAPAIHHGADDNASGTAAVLALAERFAAAGKRPARSIVFVCFSGEELGLLGSAHYVKSPPVPLAQTVAMLNMDMIGRMSGNKLTVIGTGTGSTWNGWLEQAGAATRFALSREEGGFGGSDHQSFYNAKVPVLFFFTGLHADYHKPSDTADKINAVDAARVASLVGDVLERVASSPEKPAFQQVTAPSAPGRSRARVSLGTVPEYGANVVGVLLGGVRPGSPAEKAGLKAGDILIEFAGRTVRNVEEYTFALSEHGPGETVTIKVKRGDQVVEVKATLAESRR